MGNRESSPKDIKTPAGDDRVVHPEVHRTEEEQRVHDGKVRLSNFKEDEDVDANPVFVFNDGYRHFPTGHKPEIPHYERHVPHVHGKSAYSVLSGGKQVE